MTSTTKKRRRRSQESEFIKEQNNFDESFPALERGTLIEEH